MTKEAQREYKPVDASPVKLFFVAMLTRDITLEEAILDLLDNCVDGILRSEGKVAGKKPYEGYWAHINFDKDTFEISDNCGGIPWSLHDYAFRMGRDARRPADPAGAVGVYGIGMKRAIFKMGQQCLIQTHNGKDAYEIEITKKWLNDQEDWNLPVKPSKRPPKEEGTTIVIDELYPGIAARFGADSKAFFQTLERMVATHYAFIIDKGFVVKINKKPVEPRPTKLVFDHHPRGTRAPVVQPFIFKGEMNGVEVFLAVGFTGPIISQNQAIAEQDETHWSTTEAGWTVLCNDRAVLYCDRSELTGWGEAGVPRYHTQFIAIAGIVEFRSRDPGKLPTTTTKRGIDASSQLYLQVKNKMREGMRIFINYTNQWKGNVEESKSHIADKAVMSVDELKAKAEQLPLQKTGRVFPTGKGSQYKPKLPAPKHHEDRKTRISFTRPTDKVKRVSAHLFNGDEAADPDKIGAKCFDLILEEASK